MSAAVQRPGLRQFGEIAAELGFVTPEQVDSALAHQGGLAKSGAPHKLIGVIMIEMGAMNTMQVVRVLKTMAPTAPLPTVDHRAPACGPV